MANVYVSDTNAGKSIAATVIMRGARHVATVKAHYGNSRVLVNVHQGDKAAERSAIAARKAGQPFKLGQYDSSEASAAHFQHGSASGYGYDKFAAALAGLYIDGHVMGDHCEFSRKPPKGRHTFPESAKAPKGWSFANWTRISRATGRTMYSSEWRERAAKALAIDLESDVVESQWQAIRLKADELEREWQASDDCESGWSSCYRETGLKYLSAIGYTVIAAI